MDKKGKAKSLFVRTSYRGKKVECDTASKSDEPRWEFHSEFDLKGDKKDDVFEFAVVADGTLSNTVLGVASVNLSDLGEDDLSTGTVWLPLRSREGKEDAGKGEIRVKVALSMVKIRVMEATLPEKVSAYVYMKHGGKKYRSPTIKKTPHPNWGASCDEHETTFSVPFVLGTHFATIQVWDSGLVRSSFLGQARIRLAEFAVEDDAAPPHEVVVNLLPRGPDEPVSGTLRLLIQAYEPPDDLRLHERVVPADAPLMSNDTVGTETSSKPENEQAKAMKGVQVQVELISATGLASGETEAYAVLRYQSQTHRTETAAESVTPVFGDKALFTLGKLSEEHPEHAVLGDIWAPRTLHTDQFLGRFKLDLTDMPLDGSWQEVHGFELRGRKEIVAMGEEPDNVSGTATFRARIVKIAVDVLRASGLASKDRNGKSDPFVVVSYGDGTQSARTATISKTLDPVWNAPVAFNFEPGYEIIRIDVYDEDMISNDYLGHVELRIGDYTHGLPHRAWYSLCRKDMDDPVDGEICIQLQCIGLPDAIFTHA